MFGSHGVRHWATTQTTLSLPSGEAELHGIGKGISHALSLRSMYADLGRKVELMIHSDATAAIGIARRRGLGKLRHLDCEYLWIQAKARNKEIKLVTMLGTSNPADILTKYLVQKILQSALQTVNMRSEAGRPMSAPAAAHGYVDVSLFFFLLISKYSNTYDYWQFAATRFVRTNLFRCCSCFPHILILMIFADLSQHVFLD